MTEKSVQCLDGGRATQIWAWARIRFENGGVTGVPSPSPFLCGAIFAALQLTAQIGLYPFTGIAGRLLSDDGNGGIAHEFLASSKKGTKDADTLDTPPAQLEIHRGSIRTWGRHHGMQRSALPHKTYVGTWL